MATARVFEERIGEKTAKAECTASRITIIIAASARLALSGAWRLRKYQFSPVPSKNASEVASRGPRKAPRACGVRSRKCPMESAYSCGFTPQALGAFRGPQLATSLAFLLGTGL